MIQFQRFLTKAMLCNVQRGSKSQLKKNVKSEEVTFHQLLFDNIFA